MTDLARLAEAHGVLTSYVGADDQRHEARPDALQAVLATVTADAAGEPRSLPPVVVAWDGEPVNVSASELVTEASLVLEGSAHRMPLDVESETIDLPALPHGYHRLDAVIGGRSETATVIGAPTRAFEDHRHPEPRQWGLFAPVYALDRGKLSDLEHLVELVADYGGRFAGTLPLLPTFDSEPSPYSPVSRLFWNEHFVDEIGAPPADPTPALLDYARFRARLDGDDDDGDSDSDSDRVAFYLAAQAAAEEQLATLAERGRRRNVGLYLDLPLGVHRESFDIARSPQLFARGTDVGAPPDALFEGGQNWSFPPMLPHASQATGHDYFRRVVRHHMRYADILRIDHVMGLHRLYWIPSGFSARDGVYVRYPADELYATLTLESHRARCVVVGENLGTVPPEVDEELDRHGLLGLYVLQFRLQDDGPAEQTLASIDTHDTPTFAGFCRSDAARPGAVGAFDARLGLSNPSEMERLEAWLGWLLESDARYVSITLEDLWLEEDPQNVPGTTTEHANWSRKLRHGLDELPRETKELLTRIARRR